MKAPDFTAEENNKKPPPPKKKPVQVKQISLSPALPVRHTYSVSWNFREEDNGDQLPIFTATICNKFLRIKTAKRFIRIFDKIPGTVMVLIPYCYMDAVLILADLFCLSKRISCHGNRGIFEFLSHHLINPVNNQPYTSIQMRVLKSRTLSKPERKEQVKKLIEEIFFRFCQRESDRTIFEKYFS
jgi:hypothetical protein